MRRIIRAIRALFRLRIDDRMRMELQTTSKRLLGLEKETHRQLEQLLTVETRAAVEVGLDA